MADRLAKLEKAYRRYPDSPLFARLADLYLGRGETDEALEICRRGCQHFPDYATGFLVLSKCYEAQGEVEEARESLDQALRLDPVNPRGYRRLSGIYQKLGVPTLALKSLQQAAELDPFAEDLDVEVDELTYQVRLESTRGAKQGEVDPVSGQVVEAAGEMLVADPIEEPAVEADEVEPFALVQALPEWDDSPDVSDVLEEFKQGPNPLFAENQEDVEQAPAASVPAPEIGDIAALLGLEEKDGEATPSAEAEERADASSVEASPQVDDGSDVVAAIGMEIMGGDFVAPESEWVHYSASDKEEEAAVDGGDEEEISIFSPDILPEGAEIFQSQEPGLPAVTPAVVVDSASDKEALQADLPAHLDMAREKPAVDEIRAEVSGRAEEVQADGDASDELAPASALGDAITEEATPDEVVAEDGDMVSLAKAMSDEVVAEDDDMVPPAVTNTVAENVGGASIDLGPLVEAMVGLTSPSVQETDPAAVDEAAVVVREDTGEENIVLGGTVEEDVVVDEDRMDDEISPESAPAESETAESPATPIAGKGTGFRARGDDELLRIFQEIEDQEPEDTAAESAPPAAEETRIATVTLAEIYTIQGLTQKAIETYQQLLEQEPNNEFIRRKLEELEKGSGRK